MSSALKGKWKYIALLIVLLLLILQVAIKWPTIHVTTRAFSHKKATGISHHLESSHRVILEFSNWCRRDVSALKPVGRREIMELSGWCEGIFYLLSVEQDGVEILPCVTGTEQGKWWQEVVQSIALISVLSVGCESGGRDGEGTMEGFVLMGGEERWGC